MMDLIIKMLELDKHYGRSKNIDIAKGINKTPMTIKDGVEHYKRKRAWR